MARLPKLRAVASPPCSSISHTTTLAPSAANNAALEAPIPDAPPVTMMTLSFNLFATVLLPSECIAGHMTAVDDELRTG